MSSDHEAEQHQHNDGLRAALAVFDNLWASGDWDGQVSIGFAATYTQHVEDLLWYPGEATSRSEAVADAIRTSQFRTARQARREGRV